ncbi:MAG: site-2 protease family protein [Anaerolineales bacterium]|nr:site-2 protease family protein [Anaerolineales bacterium]
MLFQSPPPTRFDLRFSIAGIPVRVHPLFWLIALLLGSSGDLLTIPIWIFVVFVSILIHELGHAFAFRRYGMDSHIVLHIAGGLTVPESTPWGRGWANVAPSPRQQIVISLAGPLAGFLFAALVIAGVFFSGGTVLTTMLFGFLPLPLTPILPFGGRILGVFAAMLLWVNIFWGLINLLPVYPLDGGQVARNVLIQYDPLDGARKSLWVSVVTGAVVALAAFLFLRSVYMALLFGILAFQSYQFLQVRY